MNLIKAAIKAAINQLPAIPFEDINAIALWQNYTRSSRHTLDLKNAAEHFPKYQTTDVDFLYRYLNLPDNYNEKLENDALQGGLESWTKSLETAREFAKLSTEKNEDFQGHKVILKVPVSELEVLLDLDALHRDPEFKAAIAYYKKSGEQFDPGLNFTDDQEEVVARSFILTSKHIEERLN
ncbi:hypothetical protein [Yersinia ruckeri]|uniref:hypothetical protein n=1 Tax=Yersinia ruckeri TaxID=29486 RepID=UPI0022373E09|nr:hypothetical protein [Yersinia ruckeri]MCW6598787.1 hypothetical protein [Yersinia ruckeri]